jgi:phosphotriesterase-related protein
MHRVHADARPAAREVMTVRGRVDADALGFTLMHEHLLVSFQPFTERAVRPLPYDADEVVQVMLPYLIAIRERGCRTFVDATPLNLGRDPALIARLAEASGLQMLTATGNYAALDYKFLPPSMYEETAEAVARRWIDEWERGIDGTGIRPGFIKLGFNGKTLSEVEQKLIRAGAIAHLATGLTIGAHTGPAVSAFEQIASLEAAGVGAAAWIWIHAQGEPDMARHVEAARRGAWISFDGVRPQTVPEYVTRIARMRDEGLLRHVLVSQDAGWYRVGEPRGGEIRGYDAIFAALLPALQNAGFTQADIDTLFIHNPARALSIDIRRR